MSSKINVIEIITGHFNTLKSSSDSKLNYTDLFTFILLPVIVACLTVFFGFKQSDQMSSLLVNFGAIFTALLLSVLVLVYDQGNKLTEKLESNNNQPILKAKQSLLDELYYNICYSIVVSVILVFLCLIEKALRGCVLDFTIQNIHFNLQPDVWFFSPLIVFFTINLMLTILMIVKRMHTLLTTK
ncbi:hypothetical protein [Thalassotalea hakodatensis]|uniref:hypothetical protein n=1 Tax=Thalassotalea hakodatensis TaxID=3030492 RepID=UPI0025729AE7|nr:hypothetical protein [Thalassotalea hakodatensis]